MNGGVPSKGLSETLFDILDQLASNSDLLRECNYITNIYWLLERGADRNTKNQAGKTLSYYLDEKLSNILNELESNRGLLDNRDRTQHIVLLLQAGADPNTKGQDGKTLSYYLDEKLSNILNELESNRGLLDNRDCTQHIVLLLQAGADPNIQNQDGKTLLHYVAKRNDTEGISFFLEKGANPNVQDKDEKTPLHYAAKNNCFQAIDLLLKAKADQNVKDKSGKTSLESVKLNDCNTEEDSDYYSDDSRENEGNPTTPDGSVDDCSNSSGDDNKTISTEPSDCDPEDEDSSCSSSDYLFLEDSLLAKLGIPLTTSEEGLIDKFCEKIRGITAQDKQESEESILESIEKIVNEYLEKGLRLNSSCSNDNEKGDKETVTNLMLEEIEGVVSDRVNPRSSTAMLNTHDYTDESDGDEYKTSDIIIKRITSNLLLKGGMGKKFLYGDTKLTNKHYDFDYLDDLKRQYKDRKEELISIAYEGIVNKSKQTHEYDFKAEIDNVYFYMKYPQDNIIEPAKILNHEKAKELKLKVGILQIGESIVRVEKDADGKRNYKGILKGSIEMSFTTEVGEISIYLSPSKKDGNKIEVEIDEENKAKFNKLKDKSSLGKDCLLEGENVSEVISKNFKMSDSVSTESIEITKGVPFTDFTQACSQQIDTSVKSR